MCTSSAVESVAPELDLSAMTEYTTVKHYSNMYGSHTHFYMITYHNHHHQTKYQVTQNAT